MKIEKQIFLEHAKKSLAINSVKVNDILAVQIVELVFTYYVYSPLICIQFTYLFLGLTESYNNP